MNNLKTESQLQLNHLLVGELAFGLSVAVGIVTCTLEPTAATETTVAAGGGGGARGGKEDET